MIDIFDIIDEIAKINVALKEHLKFVDKQLKLHKEFVECTKDDANFLKEKFKKAFERYEQEHFGTIVDKIQKIENILKNRYSINETEIAYTGPSLENLSFEEKEKILHKEMEVYNELAKELNSFDFDEKAPAKTFKVKGLDLYTIEKGKQTKETETAVWKEPKDTLPLKDLVGKVFQSSENIKNIVDSLKISYTNIIKPLQYKLFVEEKCDAFISKHDHNTQMALSNRLENNIVNEKTSVIRSEFFDKVKEQKEIYETNPKKRTTTYKDGLIIGKIDLKVANGNNESRLLNMYEKAYEYFDLSNYESPLMINLRKKGNIIINVDDETFNDFAKTYINQIILQYLLNFPASRINFCIVDVENKCNFSAFNVLKKINNSIFVRNGIIRDDRILEDTIKDMENIMFKINDDVLSYNNVEDVYEYNRLFDANPQNFYLFVVSDFPNGYKEDTARRIQKIMQNGNKSGIYTLLINNKDSAMYQDSAYKQSQFKVVMEAVKPTALTLNIKKGNVIEFEDHHGALLKVKPYEDINTSILSNVVENLIDDAEANKQKVVNLSSLFDEADEQASSKRGIANSAVVLDIPIGTRGRDVQNLLLKTSGDGSAHAVVIGGTGSGKSNLLHTIILSTCYKYSPEDVNLYLVDFKGGVEFKYYEANHDRSKQLPHIKLTGLTSDLEDGVAILSNIQKELRRREDTFRESGVEDIVQYKALGNKMPRLFIIIDEIQELFEQDMELADKAINILREVFKKGRAFGINVLWASQNIPHAAGLKDKVLSQIGNRISLRLNNPEDASDISISPKVVQQLNRPEKGLGVINDIRYGNDAVEFRVAYAETSENREMYTSRIIEKWKEVTESTAQKPLFIVGDNAEPTPSNDASILMAKPTQFSLRSKAFESYKLVLGNDYISGDLYEIPLNLRKDRGNVLVLGQNVDITRDIMGFALASVLTEHLTNSDRKDIKINYANGELLSPLNENHLYNLIRNDFGDVINNVSSSTQFTDAVKEMYRIYLERRMEMDESTVALKYSPIFFSIHSIQRYANVFEANPTLNISGEEKKPEPALDEAQYRSDEDKSELFDMIADFKVNAKKLEDNLSDNSVPASSVARVGEPVSIDFLSAFKELLNKAGSYGIHFIMSIDSVSSVRQLSKEFKDFDYKVIASGTNQAEIREGLELRTRAIKDSRLSFVITGEEITKVKLYKYNDNTDNKWYLELKDALKSI